MKGVEVKKLIEKKLNSYLMDINNGIHLKESGYMQENDLLNLLLRINERVNYRLTDNDMKLLCNNGIFIVKGEVDNKKIREVIKKSPSYKDEEENKLSLLLEKISDDNYSLSNRDFKALRANYIYVKGYKRKKKDKILPSSKTSSKNNVNVNNTKEVIAKVMSYDEKLDIINRMVISVMSKYQCISGNYYESGYRVIDEYLNTNNIKCLNLDDSLSREIENTFGAAAYLGYYMREYLVKEGIVDADYPMTGDCSFYYSSIAMLDYVISCLFDKYNDYTKVEAIFHEYLDSGDVKCFTRDMGNPREIMTSLNKKTILGILRLYGYESINDYIEARFGRFKAKKKKNSLH